MVEEGVVEEVEGEEIKTTRKETKLNRKRNIYSRTRLNGTR